MTPSDARIGSLASIDGSRVDVDYSNTDPLGGRRTFPCAGKKAGPIVATYSAGDSIDVVLTGSATHDGGHWLVLPRNGVSSLLFLTCAADGSMDSQFALSYDAGVSWVVLKTVYRECLRGEGYNYSVPIPSSAPKADRAVLLWTWMNAIGNRE